MPKFELNVVHRQDDGVAKSVNKIEAQSFLDLLIQLNEVVAELAREIEENIRLRMIKEHEDNHDFPF